MLCSNELNRSSVERDAHLLRNYTKVCLYLLLLSIIEAHQMNVDQLESNEFRQFLCLIEGQTFDHSTERTHFSNLAQSQSQT